ncbi:MAG: MBL fold metallo-hydrolase [Clostridia bacterium]|nr:MBL fold metallo-hydrolase [Clostridia bacterium]
MELRFAPLFSGSSGNAIYVGCDEAHFLVDAGVSGTRVAKALEGIGVAPGSLSGILVTHEHSDHIQGIGVLSRKYDVPIYATEGTWDAMMGKIGAVAAKNICMIEPEINFFLGPVEIMAFSTPHDAADSVGYAFELERAKFALATDIGCVRDSWFKHVKGADAVLLESNYDPDMLKAGPYPYDLKKRILSRRGHLSNDDAGETAAQLVKAGARQIVLGHLSKENNFPELAQKSVEIALMAEGIENGRDVDLRVALRDATTGIFSVGSHI